MELKSAAFQDGEKIPARHTCQGQDISPGLSWDRVPEKTWSFALVVDDPDAPSGTFSHWVIFNIPADRRELPEAVPSQARLPSGARQGKNDSGQIGYGGPCPPPGSPHHYRFSLYALDQSLELMAGVTRKQVLNAISGHILARAQLVGIYQR